MLKIVAEIGGSHGGDFKEALNLVYYAYTAGATHVKFQCFKPEQMCVPDYVLTDGPWAGRKLLDLYKETHTPRAWFPRLFEYARELEIVPFASVFHANDVDFLETLNCEIYKISSFEAVDLELIAYAAGTGKQIMLSTGMLEEEEISDAELACQEVSGHGPILFKCTSAYPADASEANLNTILDWMPSMCAGISDHTPGCGVAVAAVALGATVVEKHLKSDKDNPDCMFSMDRSEFARMAEACKQAYAALGKVHYGPTESEKPSLKLRRSLWWARDVNGGEDITRMDIKCCRPADGIEPSYMDQLVVSHTTRNVKVNTPVSHLDYVQWTGFTSFIR